MVARVNTSSRLHALALALTLPFVGLHKLVDRRLHAIIAVGDIAAGESAEGNTGIVIVGSLPPAHIRHLLHAEVEEGGPQAMKGVVSVTVIGDIRRHLEIEAVVAATQHSRLALGPDLGHQDQGAAVAHLVPFHLAVARRVQGLGAELAKIYAIAGHAVPHLTTAEDGQCSLKGCVGTHV